MKFLKFVRKFYAKARALSNKVNKIEIGYEFREKKHFL